MGGLFGALASPGRPTHPTPHQKHFPQKKMNQRGRKFEADFRYTNFFFGLWVSFSNSLCPVRLRRREHPSHGGTPAWLSGVSSHAGPQRILGLAAGRANTAVER